MKKLTFVYCTIMMSSLAVAEQDLPLGPLHVGDLLSKVGRSERWRFNDGWTADGAAVTLPHTWNAVDGADGIPDGVKWNGNSAFGEGYYARKCVRYERNLPDPKPGKRYFLRFEGASTKAEVHVNNWPIGRHSGAYTAFTFEITEALQSQSNRVEVVVDNRRDPDMPTISADFTVFGGLYRDVWLYETDPVCVDPTRYPRVLSANPDGGYTIVEVPMLGMDDLHLERRFPHPEPWSPEHPKMYSFDVDFGEGNVLKIPFGFRKAEFRADGFYLNGVKRKLRGVNRHQDRAGKGWAVSHEDEAEDIAFVKRMGADALRTAHYPQSQNLYDLCDREGLVVWCEAPNTDIVTSSPEFRANLLNQVREMVEQYGNHPSICMWSLFNELHINYLLESKSVEIVEAEKALFTELDKTRPVVAAGCVRDVTRLNAIPDALAANFYPGWYHDTPAAMAGLVDAWCATNARVSLGVSEYGAGGSVKQHQNPIMQIAKPNLTRVHPEECQAEVHLGQYRALAADPRVWGTFIWCMFDFASDSRSEGELKGINDKGLVTYDRKDCKDAYYLYAANWSTNRILHLVGSRATTCASNQVSVIVFSNVGEVTLRVNGVKVGSMAPDEVRSVRWDGVSLVPGDNEVSVSAGGLVRTAHWRCEAGMGLGSSASVVSPTLPPLFTFSDGTPVRTAADWRRRREEMKKILEHEQYGERPVGKPDGLSFEPLGPDRVMMDGAAVRKRVRIGWRGPVRAGSFTATAFIPTQPKNGPAPAFLLICNRDPAKNIDPERRQKSDFWPAEEIVRRGYAAIAFYNGEVASDHPKAAFTNGVFGCWNLTGERAPHSWGTLSAWAWGASRVLDWIETEPTIDARRVAVIGHSRAGKTALLAAALDERFALACVNNSGCCGAKLHRFSSAGSEYVQRIVDWFPHWFCPHFSRYAGRDAEVPFDQHQLVSLIAPRLCAVGSSADDHWAGQLGEWMSLREASPVWELLGRPGLVPSAMPELAAGVPVPGTCVNSGSLAYHCTAGGHKLAREDWARYMDFADWAMCGRPARGFVYGIEFRSGDPEEDATRFYLDSEKKTWLDVNYDEAKAGEGTYALEDPLAFVDGRKVKTPADGCAREKNACCTDPVIGNWGLKLGYDSMNAGHMIVSRDADGKPQALVLWRWASPVPMKNVVVDGCRFSFDHPWGFTVKGELCGPKCLKAVAIKKDGLGETSVVGWKNPEVEPASTADAKLGAPIDLLKEGIAGWETMEKGAKNGWSVKDEGSVKVLSNKLGLKADGSWAGGGANLRTKRDDFYDFNLEYDVRVPAKSNSGVYLRGRYECQVIDSYGKAVDCHNMAAYYGRVTPTVAAEKKPGEWQHVSVTLYKRHITVVLNGQKIIDNAPVVGITGGAIDANEFVPGPLYLQGDHSDADYKNMILRPAM